MTARAAFAPGEWKVPRTPGWSGRGVPPGRRAEVRTRVAERLGIPGSEVLLTAGAAAGLFLVALVHSDGEILAGLPCYPPMLDTLRGLGARVITVTARFEDGYRIDLDARVPRRQAAITGRSAAQIRGAVLAGARATGVISDAAAMSREPAR
jgi:DNA-binding transcriptional MocR family regulator